MSQQQIGIPVEVRPAEIARKQTLGGAIELCAELAGFDLNRTTVDAFAERGFVVDKAQFSRWKDGSEGIVWPKLTSLMNVCGNDAPVPWMLHQRNWDLHSLRRRESDLEKEVRLLREDNARLRAEREIEMRVVRELRAP